MALPMSWPPRMAALARPLLFGLALLPLFGARATSGAPPRPGTRAVAPYKLIDLGLLGGAASVAHAINDQGVIIGSYQMVSGANVIDRGFRWERGVSQDLGGLSAGLGCIPYGINNGGVIVGSSVGNSGNPEPFIWRNGAISTLLTGGLSGSANGINDRGQVTGDATINERPRAFLFDNGAFTELPTDLRGYADDINSDGVIAGNETTLQFDARAFIYENGQVRQLMHSGNASARGLNDNKVVIGEFDVGTSHAYRWQNGTFTDLGTLGAGSSEALDINNSGQIVGYSNFTTLEERTHAFLWQNGAMTDLNGLIPAGGGLTLEAALGINSRGQIVGYGTDSQGRRHAFLLTFADLQVTKTASPEPAVLGGNIIYTIAVKNNGPETATSVTVTDTLPGGVTFQPAQSTPGITVSGSTLTFTAAELAAGNTATVTVVVTPAIVGNYTNTVTVAANEGDPIPANNTASVTTTVVASSADLGVTKTAAAPSVAAGANATFNIRVTNHGPGAATGVTLTDALPAGLTFVPELSSPSAVVSGSNVSFAIGSLVAGVSMDFVVVAKTSGPGSVTNNASATGTSTDATPGNNTGTAAITVTAAGPNFASFRVSPARIKGGKKGTLVLKLAAAAPTGGAIVTFTSSNPGVIPVPRPVSIPARKTTPTRAPKLKVNRVTATTTVTLTATAGGAPMSATVTVLK